MSGLRTEFDGDRDQYGGDCAILATIPRIHPKTGMPLAGTRMQTGMEDSYTTLLRGDIIFAENPEAEYTFFFWDNDGSAESRRQYMTYTLRKGYVPCKASEWILRPELAALYEEKNDQIVIVTDSSPLRPAERVLMCCPKARWELNQRKLQQIDHVVKESEQRIAGSFDDKRVQALPTTLEITPHTYNPDKVAVRVATN
jgi:hypothetical protein